MHSRILTWLFAVLLLGMQQGAQLHALAHLGEALDRPHEQGLQLPADDEACAICALFAGGSNAITSAAAAGHGPAAALAAPHVSASAPAAASPTYYLSRAPPPLL